MPSRARARPRPGVSANVRSYRGSGLAWAAVADSLVIRGAREHNLRNVDLELPRDKLIVFTGLSGSGKSSLAFDTIYAEGQRRYVESLSAYARQFLGQMDKPDVDFIEGLSPAISIDQKSAVAQPPLDGRHHHRGLRLPAPAVRPHRRAPLPRVRRRDHPPDPAADRRPHPRAARGHPLPGAGAGGAGPQGRPTRRCSPTWPRRASPGPGSTASCIELGRATVDARPLRAAHDRGRRRPPGAARRHRAPPHRLARDGAAAGRGRGRGRDRRRATGGRSDARRRRRDAHVHPAPRLPQRPRQLRGAGAPQLLVQLALRRLRALRRPRHPLRGRPRAGRPQPRPHRSTRAPSPRGRRATASTSTACSRPCAEDVGIAIDTPWPHADGQAAARRVLHGTGVDQVRVKYKNRYGRDAHLPRQLRGRRSRTSSAATPRPRPTPAASRSRATCARCRARRAAAPGSSRSALAVTIDGRNISEICAHVDRRGGQVRWRPSSCPSATA